MTKAYTVVQGDCLHWLRQFPSGLFNCCVTSPPYFGLRDYGVEGQIGLEDSPEAFVSRLVEVFQEVKRVLRDDGTLWLNLGDSYAGGGEGFVPQPPPLNFLRVVNTAIAEPLCGVLENAKD